MKILSQEPCKTQTFYCLEIEVGYFKQITAKDWKIISEPRYKNVKPLSQRLKDLGIEERTIEYDNHFGPFVHYALEPANDTPEMHQKIRKVIQDYCR